MSDSTTSKTSQKLKQTSQTIFISEIRSLNSRVSELLEQFGLLTQEIVNVADDLERQQVGTDAVRNEFQAIKEQFSELGNVLKDTQKKVGILERKLSDMEQRTLGTTTYHQKDGNDDEA